MLNITQVRRRKMFKKLYTSMSPVKCFVIKQRLHSNAESCLSVHGRYLNKVNDDWTIKTMTGW